MVVMVSTEHSIRSHDKGGHGSVQNRRLEVKTCIVIGQYRTEDWTSRQRWSWGSTEPRSEVKTMVVMVSTEHSIRSQDKGDHGLVQNRRLEVNTNVGMDQYRTED